MGYVMRAPGSAPVVFKPEEVKHFALSNPTNSIYGEGRVELLIEEAGIDLMALRSNKAIFQNGLSRSAVMLMDENATQSDAEGMTGLINQKHTGTDKRHKVRALSRVHDFKPYTLTPKEMDFLGLRNLSTKKVTTVTGVPEFLLGNHNTGNDSSGKFLVREFHETIAIPVQEIFAEGFSEDLVHTVNDELKLFFNKPSG